MLSPPFRDVLHYLRFRLRHRQQRLRPRRVVVDAAWREGAQYTAHRPCHSATIGARIIGRVDSPRDGDPAPSTEAAVGRGIFLVFLVIWTTTLVGSVNADRVNGSLLHLPNLVFHEAGHVLFTPFGRFLTVLGGSLTQVLVPLVCAGAFLWQTRDPFGAAVAVWWAGENLIDVAPYINDARDLQLVLLGGRTGAEVEGHDWEYLLNAMGVAQKDHAIASAVQALGTLTMVWALIWGAMVVWSQVRTRR